MMMKNKLLTSLVVAAIGITAIVFWIVTLPTPAERDAALKDSDIKAFMTGIQKIRYVVVDIDTGRHIEMLLKSPSDMEIVSLETALRDAQWKYKKGSNLELAVERYFELIYEESESRKFTVVHDKKWLVIYQKQDRYIDISGPSLKEFRSILRSRDKPERSD